MTTTMVMTMVMMLLTMLNGDVANNGISSRVFAINCDARLIIASLF